MLENLKHFFEIDKEIKKDLYNLCPPFDEYGLSHEVLVEYWDNAYTTLKTIFEKLKEVAISFDESESFLNRITILEAETMNNFSKCGSNLAKLKEFYNDKVANMNDEFIDSVKMECFGYNVLNFPEESLNKVQTVNEMLHLLHSYITNNDEFYRDVDEITAKENKNKYFITLRGENSELGNNIYNGFSVEMDVGDTDIIALGENKILIMIRDRGHALTIDIEEKNGELEINYFIPKIINPSLVNKLPGVNKVDPEKNNINTGATGRFVLKDKTELKSLYEFIDMVPTDADLELFADLSKSK